MNYTSLYIHIPFCAYICDYCAFYTIEGTNSTIRNGYLNRLDDELREKGELCAPLQTIYLGGGTPTFLSLANLEKLMVMLNKYFTLAPGCEFSIECNPDSLTDKKLRMLLCGGVNRFSVGVQSFSEKTRKMIGRPGYTSRIYTAIKTLVSFGIKNFNCDLIYGVPGQRIREWKDDLIKIARLGPAHISTYSLMIENNTPLATRGVKEGDESTVVSMWKFTKEYLQDACGLRRYEVSNYAKPGFECKHNYRIWMGSRFLGAGPSACYFDGKFRWTNPSNLSQWLRGVHPEKDYVKPSQRAIEILITGLRTTSGWFRNSFREITDFDFFELRGSRLNDFIESGHMSYNSDTLRLTDKGLLVADGIARELL